MTAPGGGRQHIGVRTRVVVGGETANCGVVQCGHDTSIRACWRRACNRKRRETPDSSTRHFSLVCSPESKRSATLAVQQRAVVDPPPRPWRVDPLQAVCDYPDTP